MECFKVTPWEVSGNVDYEKLIEKFGTQHLDSTMKKRLERVCGGELHHMIRRDFFYSHRDLDHILNDYEQKKGFFLYTGRKPSKGMHIGHLVPLILTKWMQDKFGTNLYIEITDDEGFLHKKQCSWGEVQKVARENILDIIAVGFDPEKTFIFKDSEYIKNVYPLLMRASRKITNSTVKAVFGFTDSTNIGICMYPAYQTMATFFEKKRCLIPCAIDQDPYWRIQRDIADGLGYYKTAAIHSKFIPPLQGVDGKMSSSGSAENAIYLTDDERMVKRKISKYAFSGGCSTIEEHRKKGGDTKVDIPYQWMKILFEPDDRKLSRIKEDYCSGSLLSGELKTMLIERINKFLETHRQRRECAEQRLDEFMYSGTLAKEMWQRTHV